MGGGKSKSRPEFKLPESKRLNIYQLFQAFSKEEVPPLTRENLMNVWRDKFPKRFLDVVLHKLFASSQTINVEVIELFYFKLMEGGADQRAQLLVNVLGVENSIDIETFQNFVIDLMESYILILRKTHPGIISSWVSGDSIKNSDLKLIMSFFTSDIIYICKKVSVKELREWLGRCVFICDMFEAVMNFAFNMGTKDMRPVLPKANKYSSILSIPQVLAFSFLTQSHSEKNWRLLYSSLTDAQSWNILMSKIIKQGPTIVLIEDQAGSLFAGFASQSWKIGPTFYGDEYSFLVRLRPEMELFTPTGYNKNFQYMNNCAATLPNGLGMGGQLNYFTFFLSAEFGPVTVSKTSSTFKDYVPLAAYEFNFTKLEIWGIGNPDIEEENVRPTGSVMDRDPGAVALLEIAGKSMHSKALKESLDDESSAS